MAATETTETFQIPIETARTYEQAFVPALFAPWAPVTLDAADAGPGDHVLDVACGTGIVARTARGRWGGGVELTGVDLNEAMLTVAREIDPSIDWRSGDVAALPFDDDAFDVAVSQFAFMFFPDRLQALREMRRVVRTEGRLAVVVPASLDEQPTYVPLVDAAARHTDASARSMLDAYWVCGERGALAGAAADAGWSDVGATTERQPLGFDSIEAFVNTELDATPLADRITADQRRAIIADLEPQLTDLTITCHVVTGRAA